MLELKRIQDGGPESWNFDVVNLLKVGLGNRRLELLQVSCHELPKLAWIG